MTEFAWFGLEGLTLFGMFAAVFTCWRLIVRNIALAAKLHQAHEMLQHAEKLGQIGTWSINVSDQRVRWSDRVFEIHARPPKLREPPLADAIEYYHADDRALVEASVERAIEDGVPFEFTARLIAEDGTEKNVLTRGLCGMGTHGSVDRVFGVFIETAHVIQLAEFVNDNSGMDRPDILA